MNYERINKLANSFKLNPNPKWISEMYYFFQSSILKQAAEIERFD